MRTLWSIIRATRRAKRTGLPIFFAAGTIMKPIAIRDINLGKNNPNTCRVIHVTMYIWDHKFTCNEHYKVTVKLQRSWLKLRMCETSEHGIFVILHCLEHYST